MGGGAVVQDLQIIVYSSGFVSGRWLVSGSQPYQAYAGISKYKSILETKSPAVVKMAVVERGNEQVRGIELASSVHSARFNCMAPQLAPLLTASTLISRKKLGVGARCSRPC
jgi:hypothetical protein